MVGVAAEGYECARGITVSVQGCYCMRMKGNSCECAGGAPIVFGGVPVSVQVSECIGMVL